MIKLLKAYRLDGTTRAVWSEHVAADFRKGDIIPVRASRVEVITEGQHRGKFHVDFTLLAEATDDMRFCVCLAVPFLSYQEAVNEEIKWLERNWVLPTELSPSS